MSRFNDVSKRHAWLGPEPIRGFFTAWTFGLLMGPLLVLLIIAGKLRFRGYWRTFAALRRGGIIAANHPDGFTPFVLAAAFFPWYLLFPWYIGYNMPREGLVPKRLHAFLRCIQIERAKEGQKGSAVIRVIELLLRKGVLVIFPEGTRTYSPTGNKELVKNHDDSRSMRRHLHPGVIRIAQKAAEYRQIAIIPTWIDLPTLGKEMGLRETLAHILKGNRLVISFGVAQILDESRPNALHRTQLADWILHA